MKIPSSWLMNWLSVLVQDFSEVAIVNVCCLAKSSYCPVFGTIPNGGKKSFSSNMKWFLFI